jgi:hypothetical protein
MKNTTFWDVTLYILVQVHRRFGGTVYLHHHGRRIRKESNEQDVLIISCWLLGYPYTMKIVAACSSETSVKFYRTAQYEIP